MVNANDDIVHSKSFLLGNFPNPFNPMTKINFYLSETSKTKIEIYNIKGQLIKTLDKFQLNPGFQSVIWEGVDDTNKKVSSGIYFYKLILDEKENAIKKCLLLE